MKQTSTKELIKIITASSVIGLCLFGKYALEGEYDG